MPRRHDRGLAPGGAPGCQARGVSRRRSLVLPALLVAAATLSGCADSDGPGAGSDTAGSAGSTTAAPSSSGAATSSPAESTDGTDGDGDAPPFPADTEPDTAEPAADTQVTVQDIRTGRHEGFDRVVFEVGGRGTPGWDVRYVDQPASQGSGDPVEVDGAAVLQVTITGAGLPFDTGVEEWSGPDPLPGQGTEVVTEVVWDATFEGTSVAFVGTTARAPFRVQLLEQPTRVVLEVAHPS
jgi:hypothetical protein